MHRTHCGLALLSLLVACGDGDGSGAGDSGADAGDTGLVDSLLDIPWLDMGAPPIAAPLLTPCPEGWLEVGGEDSEEGPVTCHPYDGEPDVCPHGSAHFVGDAACTPVGAPCPLGDFPEGLPTDAEVLYVLSSAPPGGDGSAGSPLMTITDALNVASRETVIAIGKGTYDEALRVGPGITLWGACASETRVTASSPSLSAQAILTVPSANVRLKNLSLGPANLPGLAVFGTRASVSLEGLVIEGAQQFGVFVNRGARLDGRELSISGTRPDATGTWGRGLVAIDGGIVDLTRVFLSRNHDAGVLVQDDGTSVTLSDVVVEDTQGQASDGTAGHGLNVQYGATAQITRALFSGNRDICVFVSDEGTSLTLSDVVVEDTQGQASNGVRGRGLEVQLGATADVTRALFSGNGDAGMFVHGAGTSLTLSDVVAENTHGQASDGEGGVGLGVQLGAAAVARALFSGNESAGVFVNREGAVTLSDVVVEGTREQAGGDTAGRGLSVQFGAMVEVTRALFSGNEEAGVLALGGGTSLSLSDVVIEDTQGRASDGGLGRALVAQSGPTVEVARALLSRNGGFGVLASGPGASMRLSDVVVEDTNPQVCARTTCPHRPFGVALAGISQAHLVATRFEARDSALCGVLVQEDAQVDLSLGQVSGSPIGVCLQVDDYAIPRLSGSVRYVDNETNLDATSLPVPEPVSEVQAIE